MNEKNEEYWYDVNIGSNHVREKLRKGSKSLIILGNDEATIVLSHANRFLETNT
jgi:ribosomal protein L7Ae-like RNA K-turn-binding protein